jgi:hypothetical protein
LAAQGLHDLPDFQVTLRSEARLMQFRDLLVSNQLVYLSECHVYLHSFTFLLVF